MVLLARPNRTDGVTAASRRPSRSTTETLARRELAVGGAFLGLAALGGLLFLYRPSYTPLDTVGFALLPFDYGSAWAHDVTHIASLPGLVTGVVLLLAGGVTRGWRRALACASAPVVAVFVVEQIAKPLVHRHVNIYGGPSYPSGTVTVAAAFATGALLIVPRSLKVPTALIGAALVVATCAAVVVLRYHAPTDALGGICTGAGTALLVDALMHLSCVPALKRHVGRQPPA